MIRISRIEAQIPIIEGAAKRKRGRRRCRRGGRGCWKGREGKKGVSIVDWVSATWQAKFQGEFEVDLGSSACRSPGTCSQVSFCRRNPRADWIATHDPAASIEDRKKAEGCKGYEGDTAEAYHMCARVAGKARRSQTVKGSTVRQTFIIIRPET